MRRKKTTADDAQATSPELVLVTDVRRRFCEYVLAWKRTGKLDVFIEIVPMTTDDPGLGVAAIGVIEHLAGADDPVPDEVAAALGLPAGTSYADATVPVIEAWNAPIIETPEEEEAERELRLLFVSEVFEQFNATHPDAQIPIVYPKATRRRQ